MYARNNDFFADPRLALNPDPHFLRRILLGKKEGSLIAE
jgi:hypothetical protein